MSKKGYLLFTEKYICKINLAMYFFIFFIFTALTFFGSFWAKLQIFFNVSEAIKI